MDRTITIISAFIITSSARRTLQPLRDTVFFFSLLFFILKASLNSSMTFDARSGFGTKVSTPACFASSATSSQLNDVRMIIADSCPISFLISRVVSIPSISGIFQSTRIRLYGSRLALRTLTISSPWAPESAISQLIPTWPRTSFACSQATGSSSIARTAISWGVSSSKPSSVSSLSDSLSGTVTVNVVPSPFLLSTSICPFISSTRLFVIGMPRPVLPNWFVEDESSWEKASNILGRYSSLIPIPLSRITNLSVELPSYSACFLTVNETSPPSGVNFTEFPSILMSICFSFISSPI